MTEDQLLELLERLNDNPRDRVVRRKLARAMIDTEELENYRRFRNRLAELIEEGLNEYDAEGSKLQ